MSELARVAARDLSVDVRLVQIVGEIDLSNAHDVMSAIAGAVPNDTTVVILDLSGTAYLDSSGIAMIFRLAERLRYRRQELRLVVPASARIRAMLELTKVDHVIPVQEAITDLPESG